MANTIIAGGMSQAPGADNSLAARRARADKRLAAKKRAAKGQPAIKTIRDFADETSTVGVLDGSSDGVRAKTIKEALKRAGAD